MKPKVTSFIYRLDALKLLALIMITANYAAHLGSRFYVKPSAVPGQLKINTAGKSDEPLEGYRYLSHQNILETSAVQRHQLAHNNWLALIALAQLWLFKAMQSNL